MQRLSILIATALISSLLLTGCNGGSSSAASSSEASSVAVSSEAVVSEESQAEVSSEEVSEVSSTETSSSVSEDTPSEGPSEETSSEPASEPTAPSDTAGGLAFDSATAASLLSTINSDRTAAGKAALAADAGLDAVAQAYAKVLYEAGADFRKTTDYKTLPTGEKVSSLIRSTGYTGTVSNFNYSVYCLDNTIKGSTATLMAQKVTGSSQYTDKAVNGDFTKTGIAFGTVSDGTNTSFSILVIVYSK